MKIKRYVSYFMGIVMMFLVSVNGVLADSGDMDVTSVSNPDTGIGNVYIIINILFLSLIAIVAISGVREYGKNKLG